MTYQTRDDAQRNADFRNDNNPNVWAHVVAYRNGFVVVTVKD